MTFVMVSHVAKPSPTVPGVSPIGDHGLPTKMMVDHHVPKICRGHPRFKHTNMYFKHSLTGSYQNTDMYLTVCSVFKYSVCLNIQILEVNTISDSIWFMAAMAS